jgi:L-lactate dehydrogenase complex protein LldG
LGIPSAEGHLAGTSDRAERLQALEPAPICISGADAAIAESGTLLVMSGPGRGRLASLLPPIHIAILPVDCIVRSLPDAFALIAERWGPDVVHERANITLISGPSRTADIEQSLTLGVHGPKEIHVVIVGVEEQNA